MPKFKVVVRETVEAHVEYEIEADTREDAGIYGLRKWVCDGEGTLQESVEDRWVEVDGQTIEDADEDSPTSSEVVNG